jgi:hypothetical protein
MEGLLDHSLRDVHHARGRHRPLRVGVHPHHRPAAAAAGLHPHRARAAERQPHRRRRAGAAAAAGLRPDLPGRQRGCAGGAGRRPASTSTSAARPRWSTATAAAPCCWTSRSWCSASCAPCGARCRPPAGVGQDAPGHARRIAHAGQCTGCAGRRRRELVVHARTKDHGYRPPAYWEHIAAIREHVACRWWPTARCGRWPTPTLPGRERLRRLMLGRGIVADPGLALAAARPGVERLWRRGCGRCCAGLLGPRFRGAARGAHGQRAARSCSQHRATGSPFSSSG